MRSAITFGASLFLGMLTIAPALAGFQPYGGGITVRTEQWPSHSLKTEFEDPAKLKSVIDFAWGRQQDGLCDQVKAKISRPNAIAKGVNAYSVVCNFTSTGSLAIDTSRLASDSVGLRYTVPNNGLTFKTTTPTVFGSSLDPSWSLGLDIVLDMNLSIAQPAMNLVATSAVASLANPHFDSHNIPADLALTFQPSIRTMVNDSISKNHVDLTSTVNDQLKLVSALALHPFAQQGFTVVTESFPGDRLILTFGGKQYAVRTSGPGKITGTVFWDRGPVDKSLSVPCGGLAVQAVTVNGYEQSAGFGPPSTKVGDPNPTVTGGLVGNVFRCDYTLTGLPLGEPLQISVKAKAPSGYFASLAPAFVSLSLNGIVDEKRRTTQSVSPGTGSSISMSHPAATTATMSNATVSATTKSATPSKVTLGPAANPNEPGGAVIYGPNDASNVNFKLTWVQQPH